MLKIEDYLDKDGFIDIPLIVSKNLEEELFPGYLSNIKEIRKKDFPIFDNVKRIYLDTAATSQEPLLVKEKIHEYRINHIRGSNHSKHSSEAVEAKEKYEQSRKKLQDFFHASNYIVVFTSGTTGTSNWIATRFPLTGEDLLIITEAEHNSQIVTARNIARKVGADICYIPVFLPEGDLNLDVLKKVVSKRKSGKILLNLVHASNVSGIINPVKEIRKILGNNGFIYLDLAQSAGHMPIHLDDLDVDFAGVSSHKMYGPMGIGAIFINKKSKRYVKSNISGGTAVKQISKWLTKYSKPPIKFEPGTQDLEGAIEWGYTIDYLNKIGMKNIEAHDKILGEYFIHELQKIKGIRIYGSTLCTNRTSVVMFNIGAFTRLNYDRVAKKLNRKGISVSDGCFCAHIYAAKLIGLPEVILEIRTGLMKLGVNEKMLKPFGAVRASFAFYNTLEDAYNTIAAIREISTIKIRRKKQSAAQIKPKE
jgi:cysteine desulfurase/selenocysteine lyase